MSNLRAAGVPFGISTTATRFNAEEILSDQFLDFFFDEQQALFGWMFQYMPIGRAYSLDRLGSPEQRAWMWQRSWRWSELARLCLQISGTSPRLWMDELQLRKGYFYINWNGTITPCVFSPYSTMNINDLFNNGGTLNDVYESPSLRPSASGRGSTSGVATAMTGSGKATGIGSCPVRSATITARAESSSTSSELSRKTSESSPGPGGWQLLRGDAGIR